MAAPPAGVTGMALDGRVELAWQPAAGATGYRVYRGTSPGAITTPLMTSPMVPPDLNVPASFVDIGAVNGTTYYYAVRAIIGGVESANSRIVQATPRAAVVHRREPRHARELPARRRGLERRPRVRRARVRHAPEHRPRRLRRPQDLGAGRLGRRHRDLPQRLLRRRRRAAVRDAPGRAGGDTAGMPDHASLGLLDCANWSVTQTITTTTAWPSGVYLIRVTRNDTNADTHVLLVVRDDAPQRRGALRRPDDHVPGVQQLRRQVALQPQLDQRRRPVSGSGRAVKVSFDRPYEQQHDDIAHDWYTRTDYATVRVARALGLRRLLRRRLGLRAPGRDRRAPTASSSPASTTSTTRRRCAPRSSRRAAAAPTCSSPAPTRCTGRSASSRASSTPARTACWSATRPTQSGGADPSGISTSTWRDPAGAEPARERAHRRHVRRAEGLRLLPDAGHRRAGPGPRLALHRPRHPGHRRDRHGRHRPARLGVGRARRQRRRARRRDDARGLPRHRRHPAGRRRRLRPGLGDRRTWSSTRRPSGALVVTTGTNHWAWGLADDARGDGEPDRRIQQATTNILMDMGVGARDAGEQHRARRPDRAAADHPAHARRPERPTSIPRRSSARTFSRPMDAVHDHRDVRAARAARRLGRRRRGHVRRDDVRDHLHARLRARPQHDLHAAPGEHDQGRQRRRARHPAELELHDAAARHHAARRRRHEPRRRLDRDREPGR